MEYEIGKTYLDTDTKYNVRIIGELKQFCFYAYFDDHHNIIVECDLIEDLKERLTESDYDDFELVEIEKQQGWNFIGFSYVDK